MAWKLYNNIYVHSSLQHISVINEHRTLQHSHVPYEGKYSDSVLNWLTFPDVSSPAVYSTASRSLRRLQVVILAYRHLSSDWTWGEQNWRELKSFKCHMWSLGVKSWEYTLWCAHTLHLSFLPLTCEKLGYLLYIFYFPRVLKTKVGTLLNCIFVIPEIQVWMLNISCFLQIARPILVTER